MLKEVFKTLDLWLEQENAHAAEERLPTFKKSTFKILGQTALLEASLDMEINATVDVDALSTATHVIIAKFSELLTQVGMTLDPLSDQIWMPEETRFIEFFHGKWVHALRAEPVHILISKALKAAEKNKSLVIQYLTKNPPREFFDLCQKYGVNLDFFLES